LHKVLGFSHASEHSVSDPKETTPGIPEGAKPIVLFGLFHAHIVLLACCCNLKKR
jgi:hypothetical protein